MREVREAPFPPSETMKDCFIFMNELQEIKLKDAFERSERKKAEDARKAEEEYVIFSKVEQKRRRDFNLSLLL